MLYSIKFTSNSYMATSSQRCSLYLKIPLIVTGNFGFLEHLICIVYFLGLPSIKQILGDFLRTFLEHSPSVHPCSVFLKRHQCCSPCVGRTYGWAEDNICLYYALTMWLVWTASVVCLNSFFFFNFWQGEGCNLFKGDLQREAGEGVVSAVFSFSFCLRENSFGLFFCLKTLFFIVLLQTFLDHWSCSGSFVIFTWKGKQVWISSSAFLQALPVRCICISVIVRTLSNLTHNQRSAKLLGVEHLAQCLHLAVMCLCSSDCTQYSVEQFVLLPLGAQQV